MRLAAVTILILALLLCIPVLVGVYVWRDATRRGMNAALWTLIAVLVPALLGFVIYLLVRGGGPARACPGCGAPVKADWAVCPHCARPLPEPEEPPKRSDRGLVWILGAVIVIPAALIVLTLLSFSATGQAGGVGVTSLPIDDYLSEVDNPQVKAWLDGCGERFDTACALRHESTDGETVRVRYLIYLPCLADDPQVSIADSSNLFGRTVTLRFPAETGNAGNTLLLVTCTGDGVPKLRLYYGGERVQCEITDVDYPIGLSDQPE